MTLLTRGILLSVLGLAACSDSGPAPYTLTISKGATMYAAAQDGDGAWQQLTFDASGTATFEVTRGYHGVVTACGSFLSGRFHAGAEPSWTSCSTSSTFVRVSGAVNPAPATVWMQNDLWDATDGTYRVSSAPGLRDLVATTEDRALVLRDQQLDADRTIDLDIATDGFPLTTLTPTVTGNGADPYTPVTEILTANGTWVQTSSTAFAVVPAAQRVPGDRVVIAARLEIAGRTQVVQREVTADVAPALVFEPLPALTIDRTGLRWGEGWDFTAVTYGPYLAPGVRTHLMITGDWAAASGATALPLVDGAALPGWDASWGWPAAGTEFRGNAWAGIGDLSGDYRANFVEATLTW